MDGHYPHPKITSKAYQLYILVSSCLTVNIEESKLVVLIVVTHDTVGVPHRLVSRRVGVPPDTCS